VSTEQKSPRPSDDYVAGWNAALDAMREGLAPGEPNRPDAMPATEPVTPWDDPRVQKVYAALCDDQVPPAPQHWEGWTARRIIDLLFPA
jgi:hypothetical protein